MLQTSRIREGCGTPRAGELPAPGLRRSAWCSDRAADAEDPGGRRTPRAGELPAPGLRRSAWCSDRAAGAEDPEGSLASLPTWPAAGIQKVAAHPGPASCPLLGSGDLPGALTELSAARIQEAAARPEPASCPLLSVENLAGCSGRAADVKNPVGSLVSLTVWTASRIRKTAAHPGGRVVRSWAPGICLALLTDLPVPRIREAAAHPGPLSYPLLGFGDSPGYSYRAAGAEDPGGRRTPRAGEPPGPGLRGDAWCSDRAARPKNREQAAANSCYYKHPVQRPST